MQEGFISDHALQLGKGPLRISGIGFALLGRGTLAFAPLGTLSDIGQVLQPIRLCGCASTIRLLMT